MRTIQLVVSGMIFFFLSMGVNAQVQTSAEYFAGKWNVMVKGTPNGDAAMIFNLGNLENKITGVITDTAGVEVSKISGADLGENAITLYFNASGYDINLTLSKKDEDHVTGNMLGMFEAEGERIK